MDQNDMDKVSARLELYQKAINNIDDLFEYRFRGFEKEQLQREAYKIIRDLDAGLRTTK